MSDDKSKRGPQDANFINLHEPYEVAYWTKHFGVSAEELATAVHTHGNGAKAVAAALGKIDA